MGSAMCFPVEAMVFYTLVQTAIHRQLGWRPTARSIRKLSKRIDIYGDDIIVPVEYADAVVDELESYGLKVNVHKSFRFSHFRESCGGDFFNGYAVKPVYAREFPHDDRRQWTAETVMSWVATADQFYMAGMWQMAQTIRDMLESVLRTRIPRSRVQTHGVGFASLMFDTECCWRSDIQGWYQRRIVYTPSKRKDIIDGDAIACFNKSLGTTRAPVRFGILQSLRSEHNMLQSPGRIGHTDSNMGSVEPDQVWHTPYGSSEDLGDVFRADAALARPASPSSDGVVGVQRPRRARVHSTRISKVLRDTFKESFELDFLASATVSIHI